MSVDADITVDILRNMRDEMRAGFAEMHAEMRAGFADIHVQLGELRDHVGAIELRLGTVERVVVAMSREIAHLITRVDKLEARDHP